MFLKPPNTKKYLKSVLYIVTDSQNAFLMSISVSLIPLCAEVCSCLETHAEPAKEQENGNICKAD